MSEQPEKTIRFQQDTSKIFSITLVGLVANLILSALKIIVGKLAGSISLIADGIHSLSDLGSDIAILIGIKLSLKPADKNHPYGHGKIEILVALFIAFSLIAISCAIAYRAFVSLFSSEPRQIGISVLVVALISVIAKELLYRFSKIIADKTESNALLANAWHHRSDALSSFVVVIAAASNIFFDFLSADFIGGIVVALMIVWSALTIIRSSIDELLEGNASPQTVEKIKQALNNFNKISGWHNLRIRKAGRHLFIDSDVLVAGNLSVEEGHKISGELKDIIRQQLYLPATIMIHIEPHHAERKEENKTND